MDIFFKKINAGILNDHFDQLGGGTVHSFKFIEYLKEFYNCDVYLPKEPKSKSWMQQMLNIDTDNVNFYKYTKGIGEKYKYLFLNISHWKAEETEALKKFMLVFFPQFFFPTFDYKFLANSEYTKNNIIKRWHKSAKDISIVYPPIMTDEFKSGKKENIILHVSRLSSPRPEADKGHAQMIEVFKKMYDDGITKDWEFHLVGQVQDPQYVYQLKQQAKGYPIVFNEGIPFAKLKQLYAKAKIYWHLTGITMPHEPGAQEHFGMTTVEAMASGCVPVVLTTGGQPEIVDEGKNGFLIEDLASLQRKTKFLIEDDDYRKSMSKNSIKKAATFDEKEIKKKFWSIIAGTDKVSIIIVNWNNANYTKECVERLYEVTPPGFELIIVDNASDDNSKAVLTQLKKDYPDIKLKFSKTNRGFAGGNNYALKDATRKYVCYLNNDTLPQYGWLERMIDVLENKPKAGVVGARLYFPKKPDHSWEIQHAGISFNADHEPKHIGRFKQDHQVNKIGTEEIEAVTGACMLVRKKLAKLNENYERGYYEDIELCLEAREQGYKVYINHEARLIHYEGTSQNIAKRKDSQKFKDITIKNKELFHNKWDKKMKKMSKISKQLDTAGIHHVQNLEIGGGENPLHPNYHQLDVRQVGKVKFINDARLLPFPSNSIKNICACYILQCFIESEALMALKEWFRCLSPEGRLELHVPDLDKVMRAFVSTNEDEYLKEIYGAQEHVNDYYHYGWVFPTLDRLLTKAGFVRVTKIKAPAHRPNSLSVEAFKPL